MVIKQGSSPCLGTKESKMNVNKDLAYVLLLVSIGALVMLLGVFVAGKTNLFDWNYLGRFLIVCFSVITMVCIIILEEEEEN